MPKSDEFISLYMQEISHFACGISSPVTQSGLVTSGSSGGKGGGVGSALHFRDPLCQPFNAGANLLANPAGSSFLGKIGIVNGESRRCIEEAKQSCAHRCGRKFFS